MLEIGFAPQRRVSFVVKRAVSGIRIGVEHVFDVSTSPNLHTGGGGGGYLVKQGWCDCVFFSFVCYKLERRYSLIEIYPGMHYL